VILNPDGNCAPTGPRFATGEHVAANSKVIITGKRTFRFIPTFLAVHGSPWTSEMYFPKKESPSFLKKRSKRLLCLA
jgi:hypothetical protein